MSSPGEKVAAASLRRHVGALAHPETLTPAVECQCEHASHVGPCPSAEALKVTPTAWGRFFLCRPCRELGHMAGGYVSLTFTRAAAEALANHARRQQVHAVEGGGSWQTWTHILAELADAGVVPERAPSPRRRS
jgi:hypothetical protein